MPSCTVSNVLRRILRPYGGRRVGAVSIYLGHTRELPEAVKHTHSLDRDADGWPPSRHRLAPGRSLHLPVVTGLGPWPLARYAGAAGARHHHRRLAGKFNPERLLAALETHRFTNISAAATHYRMMRNSGAAPRIATRSKNCSLPASRSTARRLTCRANLWPPGLQHVRHHRDRRDPGELSGAADFPVKPGSLGKPIPGGRVEVHDADGKPCAAGVSGELKVWRHGNWIATKDLGRTDEDGYFYHRRPCRRRHHLRRPGP